MSKPTPKSPTSPIFDAGDKFLQNYGSTINKLGALLKGIGEVVPVVGVGIKILGFFATTAGGVGVERKEGKQALVDTLETFLKDLESTLPILEKYDDADKRESRLTFQVKVSLQACHEWAQLIENKKDTKDLPKVIERHAEELKKAISREILEQAVRANNKLTVIANMQKLDKKKPWEYFEDAKYYIRQKKWMDAKTNLVYYRNFVEAKTPVITSTNDNGVKDPKVDRHLKYLAAVEDELQKEGTTPSEPDPLLSVAAPIPNIYHVQWGQWKKTYGTPDQ